MTKLVETLQSVLLKEITDAIAIIKNGFKSSIGWKFGKGEGRSIHLLEPLTSTPINGTKIKHAKKTKNRNSDILKSFVLSIKEIKIKTKNPNIIKIKCLIKK